MSVSKVGISLRTKSGAMRMAASGWTPKIGRGRTRAPVGGKDGSGGGVGGGVRSGPRKPGLVLSFALGHQVHCLVCLPGVWALGLCVYVPEGHCPSFHCFSCCGLSS